MRRYQDLEAATLLSCHLYNTCVAQYYTLYFKGLDKFWGIPVGKQFESCHSFQQTWKLKVKRQDWEPPLTSFPCQ